MSEFSLPKKLSFDLRSSSFFVQYLLNKLYKVKIVRRGRRTCFKFLKLLIILVKAAIIILASNEEENHIIT